MESPGAALFLFTAMLKSHTCLVQVEEKVSGSQRAETYPTQISRKKFSFILCFLKAALKEVIRELSSLHYTVTGPEADLLDCMDYLEDQPC